ncbi:MAG: endonuclease III [Fibrobacterota bacterium]
MSKSSPDATARFFDTVVRLLKQHYPRWKKPSVTALAERTRDPFRVLISTLISLRTKDEVTLAASQRLYALANTPVSLSRLPEKTIANAIYPAGFYKTKAKTLRSVSAGLLTRFHGEVPRTLDELLSFKGVGRKTANLVLTQGFGLPGICVDTHVHRISNRFGVVKTTNPEATEFALRALLPLRHWIIYNDLLVAFGQNVCRPLSPRCSECPVAHVCPKVGVTRSR